MLTKTRMVAAAGALTLLAAGSLGFARANAAPTTVSAVTHIYNDPDSGNGGTWATDDLHRAVTVQVDTSTLNCHGAAGFDATLDTCYGATVSDTGTFETIAGAKTPNQAVAGELVSHAVAGTFSGGASYVLYAPDADQLTGAFPATLNDSGTAPGAPFNTSRWPTQAFGSPAAVVVNLPTWGWTYSTPAGETWADTSTNSDGNLIPDGNITGLLAPPPVAVPVPHLSHGHAVELNPVRENVYYVQTGAESWDHFTIVGPGKINGHQGWVPGKIGLNVAVYGGLEAHHGYTVFYQPVEGQGSTVPVPGAHWGYVYFVS